MKPIQSILFQLVWETSSQQEILAGFREFMRLRPRWTLRYNFYPEPLDLSGQDALVLTMDVPDERVKLPRFAGPILSMIDFPRADVSVERDNEEIGRQAARHLLDCGFRQLAFVPQDAKATRTSYSEIRWQGFKAAADEAKVPAAKAPASAMRWTPKSPAIAWLRSISRPCGIFCANDFLALEVISIARFLGIEVPQQWGVLGADNDLILCETCIPQLSSVSIPWRKVGYEAARWLDTLFAGGAPPPQRRIQIPPDKIAFRQSTDLVASDHPKLAHAIQIIRKEACNGLSVKELLDAVGLDRRTLYQLFRTHSGKTPHQEIRGIQIRKAKDLLVLTDAPLRVISQQVGLSQVYFINNFRKATGMTPGAYRLEQRKGLGNRSA